MLDEKANKDDTYPHIMSEMRKKKLNGSQTKEIFFSPVAVFLCVNSYVL